MKRDTLASWMLRYFKQSGVLRSTFCIMHYSELIPPDKEQITTIRYRVATKVSTGVYSTKWYPILYSYVDKIGLYIIVQRGMLMFVAMEIPI